MSGRERIPASAMTPAVAPKRPLGPVAACLAGLACAVGGVAFSAAVRSLSAQTPAPVVSSPAPEPAKVFDLPAAPPADAQPAPAAVPMVTLADGRTFKLGRQKPKRRAKIWLHDYVRLPRTATLPASVDYYTKAAPSISQVYGNDVWGDCVIASSMHQTGVFTAHGLGTPAIGTAAEAVATYHAVCGPGDNGCVITDVLDYRKSHGLTVGGKSYTITDYVGVDWTRQEMVETAIYLFGAVEFGVNLPSAWENSPTWDTTATRVVGGHDIPGLGFDAAGITISTWGGTRKWTWRAATSTRWCEEAWVALSPDWAKNPDLAKLGIDVAALQADLALIGQGKAPTIPPTPPPVTPPAPVDPPAPVTPPTPSPVPTVATPPPGRADKLANIIDLATGFEVVQVLFGSDWYQPSRDGKFYTSKSSDALRAWVVQHDAAIKAEPVTPSPQAPPVSISIKVSGQAEQRWDMAPDGTLAPVAQTPR